MTLSLASLLLSLAVTAPAGKAPGTVVRQDDPGPDRPAVPLASVEDFARLCRSLEPAERVRPTGDALERGEAEARHAVGREEAIRARYEVRVPAGKLAFAPYDGPERRLSLQEPVQLPAADGAARLWPTEERGLAVVAEPAAVRRVLDAKGRGTLALVLVFDLSDEVACGTGARGKSFTVPVEPVAWRWLDGEALLAAGGAAADRPTVTAAQGARPRVDVGEPIAGPPEVKKAVLARGAELEACYAEALKRNAALDGVLVAEFGGARAAIAADSVGDAGLAVCVQRVVSPLAPAQGGKAAVPIRFVLGPSAEAAGSR
jgi:hypothetical protein